MHRLSILGKQGQSISVVACGQGPMLMLLHGFPLDHRMWSEQLHTLSQDYHVIAPEFRGFGQSTLADAPYTLADLAEDVECVRQHLANQQQIHLCGLSMGGYVALEYVARFGNHLGSLILSNTKPNADNAEASAGRLAMADVARAEGAQAALQGFSDRILGPTSREERPQVVSLVHQMLRSASAEAVARAQHAMAVRRDFCESLGGFSWPTLVVAGDEDALCPLDATRDWSRRIPKAQLAIIERCGHLSPLESPQAFNSRVLQFLHSI
ncbi:MAG: alpha/beta fold hydrolase [Planctomycetales bacterium]|nr:alpha/beta fold hydrolase [Planctomycetales bacterium]